MTYKKIGSPDSKWDANKAAQIEKAEKRLDEIENILLELPFTDPQFETLVLERNDLLIIITNK